MSRMTKYLKQKAVLESVKTLEDGSPVMDDYGKYEYESPVTVMCRMEPAKLNAYSSGGQYVNYASVYYLDDSVQVHEHDRLDGHIVLSVYPYIGGNGELVGYEVHV